MATSHSQQCVLTPNYNNLCKNCSYIRTYICINILHNMHIAYVVFATEMFHRAFTHSFIDCAVVIGGRRRTAKQSFATVRWTDGQCPAACSHNNCNDKPLLVITVFKQTKRNNKSA